MELYIDIDFLDNYFIDSDNNPSKVQKIIRSFFSQYPEVVVYINHQFDREDFENIFDNPILDQVYSNGLGRIVSIQNPISEYLFKNSNFEQTLIFMNQEQDWFQKAREKGALCFSYDKYEIEIQDIVFNLHFDHSLNDEFPGWEILAPFNLINFNSLSISDDYIFVDSSKQKINENIIPLLKTLISNRKEKIEIQIHTDIKDSSKTIDFKKEKLYKIHRRLNSIFAKQKVQFKFINRNLKSSYNFHSRTLTTNFSILKSDDGFNLMPSKNTDGDLVSKTIFDKYGYKKINEIRNKQKSYLEAIQSKDFQTLNFKIIPE